MRLKTRILALSFLCISMALEATITWQTGTPVTVGTAVTATTSEIMARNPNIFGTPIPMFARLDSSKLMGSAPVQSSFPAGQTPAGNAFLPSDATPNFSAATLADTKTYPPDASGAVGHSQYLLIANGLVRSFDKKTGIKDGVLDTSAIAFFTSVLPTGAGVSNPRLRYDQTTHTWIATALAFTSTTSYYLLAYTSDSTISPDTIWSFYSFQPSAISPARFNPNAYVDFDSLGLDSNAIYLGVNVFDNTTRAFVNSDVFVVRKSDFLAGTLTVTPFRDMIDSGTSMGMSTPRGAINYDKTATQGLYAGVNAARFGSLVFRVVDNPGGTPQLSSSIFLDVLNTAPPLKIPHLGNNQGSAGLLSGVDDRLSAPHIRDNRLYTCQIVGVDFNGACPHDLPNIIADGVRWYEIDVTDYTNPVYTQIGTLSSYHQGANAAPYYWVSTMMTNGLHDLLIGCSKAGNNSFINAAYARRPWNWPLGALQTPYIFTNSSSAYNSTNTAWGAYTTASLDPEDNMTMWLVAQYCDSPNSYGLEVVRVLSPPPPQCFTITPSTVMRGESSVTLTLKSVGSTGRAFYDPPSDFAKHLKVKMDNVVINSVTVVNPQELSLNISTVNSFTGLKSIEITNPDGQQAYVPNILQVQ